MSEIDWDKAPEGATHYCPKGSSHNGLEYGEHWLKPGFYRLPHWKKWEEDKCRAPESILVARPSPAWSGDGFPPVGVVCEMERDTGRVLWHKVRILYIGSEHAIVVGEQGEQHFLLRALKFRPIRTKEQIAADEREAAIEQMINDATNPMSEQLLFYKFPGVPFIRELMACLYGAGYRKL